jgi:hypothetical protein
MANAKLRSATRGAMWWGAAGAVTGIALGRGPALVAGLLFGALVGFIVGWAWQADLEDAGK